MPCPGSLSRVGRSVSRLPRYAPRGIIRTSDSLAYLRLWFPSLDRLLRLTWPRKVAGCAALSRLVLGDPTVFGLARLELGFVTWPNGSGIDPAWMYDQIKLAKTCPLFAPGGGRCSWTTPQPALRGDLPSACSVSRPSIACTKSHQRIVVGESSRRPSAAPKGTAESWALLGLLDKLHYESQFVVRRQVAGGCGRGICHPGRRLKALVLRLHAVRNCQGVRVAAGRIKPVAV